MKTKQGAAAGKRLQDALYFGVMYGAAYRTKRANKGRVRYKLHLPPEWLTQIGQLLWQGVLQGLAWEAVRSAALALVRGLRAGGRILPTKKRALKRKHRTLRGLAWMSYEPDEGTLECMFLDLKRYRATEALGRKLIRELGHDIGLLSDREWATRSSARLKELQEAATRGGPTRARGRSNAARPKHKPRPRSKRR